MKRIMMLCGLLVLVLAATGFGGKPTPPPPPPPAYELKMLENEFVTDGWSNCRRLNNLGDAIGVAEIPGDPLPGGTPRTSYVSTPEGRAAGTDMIDLAALFIAHLPPEEQGLWQYPEFGDINDSRQVIGRVAYVVDGALVEWRGIVAQLSVAPDGTHAITGFSVLGANVNLVAINNDGDVLASPLQVYRSGIGWGAPLASLQAPLRLSDRSAGGTLYITGTSDATRGVRLTYDVVADAVTSTVTLQGTYSKDRSCAAYDVNEAGLVVGEMRTGRSDWRAFLYEDGVMRNLGNLTASNDWNDSYSNGVNNHGDVVGGSFTGTVPGNSGLLYVHALNATYDSADTLSIDDRAIYTALIARESADINDDGMICGPLGAQPVMNEMNFRAYLLLPLAP